MTRQIHGVVKDADNFNHMAACSPIHDEMPPAATLPRNMKGSEVRENFIAGNAAENVGSSFQGGKGVKKRLAVNQALPFAKSVGCVFEDTNEILFRLGAEANPPTGLRHLSPLSAATSGPSLLR